MSTHTPGPWFVDGLIVSAAHKGSVAFAYGPSFAERSEVGRESLANARLIAAAPDLLEALQDLIDCPFFIDEATVSRSGLEETMKQHPFQVVGNMSVSLQRMRNARAAISKATGEKA